ncbi:(Fe-S)-binding protein [Campylobacter corcagiensis]|uniref:Glycolate oxidase iron-sulfur subunit n=1 Tax=Campylobacter corcagiensis TaxID=1448857 RepID=A0A7M1LG28_9BACT|nr:(Fe-S)-binding protein [Campylobacter corcagiensis]QKF64268.1 anaerobic glycerol-3-phosphate dehydrogenase [Campylobacter corcagiensis]QOQ87542.1 (Fe-S)-binding protein [Campylobacter corcagiensis]
MSIVNITDACVKCGKCIPVCTIHNINRDETTSPRGFLDLLSAYQNGDLELDKQAKEIFESCFLCTNCVDVCPSSIGTDTAIEMVRSDIADKYGISWYKKVVFWFLSHRKIMDLTAKFGYVFQSCGLKVNKEKFSNSMRMRFNLPLVKMIDKTRLLPTFGKKSFLNSYPEFIDNGGEKTIGIFIGCMGNYFYTGIGEGLLKICKTLKINAHLMKKQACCGAAMYFTGDTKTTKKNAKFNIEYFEEILKTVDAIIIPEATCSGMIRVDYEHLFHDEEEWKNRAIAISSKVFLATEYFDKFTNLAEILATKNSSDLSITCHDPCHARKMQGVYKEPRHLLAQNFSITEMSNPNQCCGFGGVTMQTNRYYLSKASGKQKVPMIEKTGAKFVSAECSACRMQLNNALHIDKSDKRCVNPIELIASVL